MVVLVGVMVFLVFANFHLHLHVCMCISICKRVCFVVAFACEFARVCAVELAFVQRLAVAAVAVA